MLVATQITYVLRSYICQDQETYIRHQRPIVIGRPVTQFYFILPAGRFPSSYCRQSTASSRRSRQPEVTFRHRRNPIITAGLSSRTDHSLIVTFTIPGGIRSSFVSINAISKLSMSWCISIDAKLTSECVYHEMSMFQLSSWSTRTLHGYGGPAITRA